MPGSLALIGRVSDKATFNDVRLPERGACTLGVPGRPGHLLGGFGRDLRGHLQINAGGGGAAAPLAQL